MIQGAYMPVDGLKLGAERPPMPFSDTTLLNVLSHTLWFLPNVASCYATYNLLRQKQNNFFDDSEKMNQGIFGFRKYENSSLSYTGIDKHQGESVCGWDTVLRLEEYEALYNKQQATIVYSIYKIFIKYITLL